MRKMMFLLAFVCAAVPAVHAACADDDPDRIVGIYSAKYEGEESKVSIFRNSDGSYSAQVIWVMNKYDGDGNVKTDDKNPDKSKRNTPCDEIVLIENMKYDSKTDSWGKAKIYDPVRGLKANVNCSFDTPSRLKVRGSVMGIGVSVYWNKLE